MSPTVLCDRETDRPLADASCARRKAHRARACPVLLNAATAARRRRRASWMFGGYRSVTWTAGRRRASMHGRGQRRAQPRLSRRRAFCAGTCERGSGRIRRSDEHESQHGASRAGESAAGARRPRPRRRGVCTVAVLRRRGSALQGATGCSPTRGSTASLGVVLDRAEGHDLAAARGALTGVTSPECRSSRPDHPSHRGAGRSRSAAQPRCDPDESSAPA